MKRRRLGGGVVSAGEDVGAFGVADVGAAVGAALERPAGLARRACLDVAEKVVAYLARGDAEQLGEALLDRGCGVGVDHPESVLDEPDVEARVDVDVAHVAGRLEVRLLLPGERFGVVLEPDVARALATSLTDAADGVDEVRELVA